MLFRPPSPLGFYPVCASQPSDRIPPYANAFYFVKLFSKMIVIEVVILALAQLNDPFRKLMVNCHR